MCFGFDRTNVRDRSMVEGGGRKYYDPHSYLVPTFAIQRPGRRSLVAPVSINSGYPRILLVLVIEFDPHRGEILNSFPTLQTKKIRGIIAYSAWQRG